MSIKDAFNTMLSLHSRTMTLLRPGAGGFSYAVKVSPSNYMRNLETVVDVTTEGREFVISNMELTKNSIVKIKRGDRLRDPNLGEMVISEVREMFGMGGEILGWRLRIG